MAKWTHKTEVDMDSNKILNVADGVDANDAVNVSQLPAAVTPAGADGDLQINNSGAFGSIDGLNLDKTGNARGTGALDIQSGRTDVTQVASGSNSTAVGVRNTASAYYSTAVGYNNTASGYGSATGYGNTATGFASSSSGYRNDATGSTSQAFGSYNDATVTRASAFGSLNNATGVDSSAFGSKNTASGARSTASGYGNVASGVNSTASGYKNKASGDGAFAIGTSQSSFADDNLRVGNDSAFLNINTTGFSVNNMNALVGTHITSDLLVTDITSLGAEKLTNGDFGTLDATGWTVGTGWTIPPVGFAVKGSDGTGTLSQTSAAMITPLVIGEYYLLTLEFRAFSPAGETLDISLGGQSVEQLKADERGEDQIYKAVIKATTTGDLILTPSNTMRIGRLQYVSVKKITGGDLLLPEGVISVSQNSTNAVIVGDVTGNARGSNSLDIQSGRSAVTDVAGGANATAVGVNNIASSQRTVAIGYDNEASGFGDNVAIGVGNTSSASFYGFAGKSSAVGVDNDATAGYASAFGRNNTASNGYASALGNNNTSSGYKSSCLGSANEAEGYDSSAIGSRNDAVGNQSTAAGYKNLAHGTESAAIGVTNSTGGDSSMALGIDQASYADDNIRVGSSSAFFNINTTGLSVNNMNALEGLHATGDVLVTDIESLGAEKVTNGNFLINADGWTLGTGWTWYSSSARHYSDGTGTLSQDVSAVAGEYYLLTFNISFFTTGTLDVSLGGGTVEQMNSDHQGEGRTYQAVIKATTTGDLIFTPSNTNRISQIEDVSVKKITGGNLLLPEGGITANKEISVPADTFVALNGAGVVTGIKYNSTSGNIEIWKGGVLVQSW